MMRRVLGAALLLPALFAQAPQPPVSTTKPVRVIVPARRIGILTEAQISLEEAVALTLSNNNDIDSSRVDRQIASLRLTAARGAYDPRVGADSSWVRAITPVSSALGGGSVPGQLSNITFAAVPQFSGLIPRTGGSYSTSFTTNRNTTDNLFATLNPQFPTALAFSVTQPLWRNLRYDDSRRQIEVGKKNNAISDEQFRQRVIETVTQAVNAYWDLVYAFRNYQIQMEAVELARRQVESNQRQADQGILAPIDVVEAETQLATFEQNIYTAQQALTRSENALKTVMLQDRAAMLWGAALIPTTPPTLEPPAATFEEAVRQALAERPELAQIQLSGEVNQANTRYYHEQTRPQVDFISTITSSGLAGEPVVGASNPFASGQIATTERINQLSALAGLPPLPPPGGNVAVPPVLVGTYGQSLSNLASFAYPTANIGVRFSLPIRNRVAESNLAASVAEERRIANQRRQTEMRVEADVRDTLQGVDSVKARLDAAVIARQSSEAQYQSEVRKFQEGTSTVFLVLQRQTTMITARNAELRAQTDLSKAIADFERATTRTLSARNINIQGVSAPRRNP